MKRSTSRAQLGALVDRIGARRIVADLEPFVTKRRRERIETVLAGRVPEVEVAIEAASDPHNAAAVVRSAEALGAGAVHVIAAHHRVLQVRRTTAGTFHWIATHDHESTDAFFDDAQGRGYRTAGACGRSAMSLEDLPSDERLVIMLGNEHAGLSERARERADHLFCVPMFGFAESYNMSVCAALCLYQVLGQRRRALGRPGSLEGDALAKERALYHLASVETRLWRNLFPGEDAQSPAADEEQAS